MSPAIASNLNIFKAAKVPLLGVIIGLVLIIWPKKSSDTHSAWKVNGESPRCPLWILLQRIGGVLLIALSLWVWQRD